jgi:hypothetical protein
MDIFNNNKNKIVLELHKLGISNDKYEITDELTVILKADFAIKDSIANNLFRCPVQFESASGNFIWHYGSLTTLEGMPKKVGGNFSVAYNNLKSLLYAPKEVDGKFICSGNMLTNLIGSPEKVGSFYAIHCGLSSLEGAPKQTHDFIVSNNNLTNLKYYPSFVDGLVDISSNKIESFKEADFSLAKKVICNSNPSSLEIISYINNMSIKSNDTKPSTSNDENTIKKGDMIIFNNSLSVYYKYKGEVISEQTVSDFDNNSMICDILFKKEDNPALLKNVMLKKIKVKFLLKTNAEQNSIFKVGDFAIIKNSKRHNGLRGKIKDVIKYPRRDISYTLETLFIDNPCLKDELGFSSYKRDSILFYDLHSDELIKTDKNWVEITSDITNQKGVDIIVPTDRKDDNHDKPVESEKQQIVLDPNNKFKIGDKAMYYNSEVELIKPNSPTQWEIKYSSGYYTLNNVSYEQLKPIKPFKYLIDERVRITDDNNKYYNQKGIIIKVTDIENDKQLLDIKLDDSTKNKPLIAKNINSNVVKLYKDSTLNENDPRVFQKNDRIIYIAKKEDTKNKDFHLYKGKINYVNVVNDLKGTYDISMDKKMGDLYEKNLVNVHWSNLILLNQNFEIDDRVVFSQSSELNGTIGVVTGISKDYIITVLYNDGEKMITVDNIKPSELVKYIKPIGSTYKLDDTIRYIKPDSEYYGLVGTITNYLKKNEISPYIIELNDKDNEITINATEDDIEVIPEPRGFKKGDKIRYINTGKKYDGLIGEIMNVEGTKKNKMYNIKLKFNRGIIYLITKEHCLMLLEETPSPTEIKIGSKIKYHNQKSRWNGCIGEYGGTRYKNNKTQLILKFFDVGNILKTIYVDEGEGKITPFEEYTASSTIYPEYNTGSTSKKKKKKEEEKEEEKKPILVYNRRNVARRYKNNENGDLKSQ